MMDALALRCIVREIPPDALAGYNTAVVHPPVRHAKREQFLGEMGSTRFDKAVSKCIGPAVVGILTAKRSILPVWKKKTGPES
jgi:hypothetical protein